jgi:hypothetical protein
VDKPPGPPAKTWRNKFIELLILMYFFSLCGKAKPAYTQGILTCAI